MYYVLIYGYTLVFPLEFSIQRIVFSQHIEFFRKNFLELVILFSAASLVTPLSVRMGDAVPLE